MHVAAIHDRRFAKEPGYGLIDQYETVIAEITDCARDCYRKPLKTTVVYQCLPGRQNTAALAGSKFGEAV